MIMKRIIKTCTRKRIDPYAFMIQDPSLLNVNKL